MNRHILTRGAVVVALALGLGACDQGLSKVNIDPNHVTNVVAGDMLPYTLYHVVGNITFPFGTDWVDWAQLTGQIQYPAETYGAVRPTTINNRWNNYYSWLNNIQAIINKGKDENHANIQAVGMIWKAFTFDQMTDQWGDIPYSDALQGASNITPKYDTQQSIYAGMLSNLTAAYSMLGATDVGDDFGLGDLIYNNNWTEWKKFDAALRMRLAMRLSQVDPTTAKSDFTAAYADLNTAGGFTNADNAELPWAGGSYGNPWWGNVQCGGGGRDDNGVSKTLVDTLLSLQDPRLPFYAEPAGAVVLAPTCVATAPNDSAATEGGTYNGLPYNGRTNGVYAIAHGLGWYSRIGNYWRVDGATTPSQILDASEVDFLEAEAVLRGWITGNAGALYTQGITDAFRMYEGVYPTAPADSSLTRYLTNPRVVWAGGALGSPGAWGAGMKQIQLQKWISLYMVGMEAWSNWRRVREPDLMPGPDIISGRAPGVTIIPEREPYPSTEQSLNATNLAAAVTAQGGGLSLITNMWWDTNSNAYEK